MQTTYVVYRRNHTGEPYAVCGCVDRDDAKDFIACRKDAQAQTTALRFCIVSLATWLTLIK